MQFKSCSSCKHRFIAITAKEKCKKSEIKLGHAIIYENCSTARSREDGCGPKGLWYEPIESTVKNKETKDFISNIKSQLPDKKVSESFSKEKPIIEKDNQHKVQIEEKLDSNELELDKSLEQIDTISIEGNSKKIKEEIPKSNAEQNKTIKFYSVKKREYIEVPEIECWKSKITKAKGKQTDKIRFSIKAKDKDGTNLSKFCSKDVYDSLNCPEK